MYVGVYQWERKISQDLREKRKKRKLYTVQGTVLKNKKK